MFIVQIKLIIIIIVAGYVLRMRALRRPQAFISAQG